MKGNFEIKSGFFYLNFTLLAYNGLRVCEVLRRGIWVSVANRKHAVRRSFAICIGDLLSPPFQIVND